MKPTLPSIAGCLASLLAFASPGLALAANSPAVVVELFTSQGCSSCPPANANLIKLSNRPDILTLSFSVTYWDYLGWKDSFGKQEFTQRQASYEPALRQSGSYTPQMVVNGISTTVGNDFAEVNGLVSHTAPLKGPLLQLGADAVSIGAGVQPTSPSDVWLVRYDPDVVDVPVQRGENSGSTLPHIHVVHALSRIGIWEGKPVAFSFPATEGRLKTAVLVQAPEGGPILVAASN